MGIAQLTLVYEVTCKKRFWTSKLVIDRREIVIELDNFEQPVPFRQPIFAGQYQRYDNKHFLAVKRQFLQFLSSLDDKGWNIATAANNFINRADRSLFGIADPPIWQVGAYRQELWQFVIDAKW